MKLRRALSVSAATAALLPLAMAAAPASQAASAAKLPKCSEVSNGQYENNALVGRVAGIPASIALGTHWTTYTATLTNTSAKELRSFDVSADLGSYVYNEGEHDLSPTAICSTGTPRSAPGRHCAGPTETRAAPSPPRRP
ncbi:hypothetical protein [Streptomyces kronopolitis]|uniref:hypothetical protein n=1 Tax=Streptomyces kronopolitis TaxID=1612435 RepID=UPI0020BFB18A|nr:hypothetical protein [Streptomyces kronopolitis]MCL6300064.1 hypothetical protein [Streptomyces kronopolitis]